MSPLADLTARVRDGATLAPADVEEAVTALVAPAPDTADKEAFLEALARRGEQPGEVAAFAAAFRRRARDPGLGRWSATAIDVVGTGGDHAGTVNISTAVVFVLAALGERVMKHGNRSITSRCGSADLLAALGVDLEAPAAVLDRSLEELGFAFLFAPAYHPAFKEIAPVRRTLAARGQRTVFNLLGPLINPGRPAHQLLGVFDRAWLGPVAAALHELELAAALVIHGRTEAGRGIDEWTTATSNEFAGAGRLHGQAGAWRAADLGLATGELSDLAGGDAAENLARIEALAEGRGPQALEDTVALNAAAALWVLGRVSGPAEGVERARGAIRGGAMRRTLEATRRFYRR